MKISWTFSFSNAKSYQQKIGGKIKISIARAKMTTEYSQPANIFTICYQFHLDLKNRIQYFATPDISYNC